MAVGKAVVHGIERIEDVDTVRIGDAGAVVDHGAVCASVVDPGFNDDMRAARRICNGVVHQVHDHLHHQTGIGIDEDHVVARLDRELVVRKLGAHVPQSLLDDVVEEFSGKGEVDAAVFELGDGEQVLHGRVEPYRIGPDIPGELVALLVTERRPVGDEHVGIARDRCQRGAKVVRDRSQEIRPQLLVFCQDRRLLAFGERLEAADGK